MKKDKGSVESSALDEDFKFLEEVAKSKSVDPATKEIMSRRMALLTDLREETRIWEETAERYGITDFCKKLGDEEIARFTALPESDDDDSPLMKLLRKNLIDPYREQFEKLTTLDPDSFLLWWCEVFGTALHNEYLRRRQQNETVDGQSIRRILVETEPERGRTLEQIGRDVARGLWFPGERPGQSEEAPSVAVEAIWDTVAPFSVVGSVASNPQVRQAVMKGSLNKTLQHARDRVRTRIETEVRRKKQLAGVYVEESAERVLGEMVVSRTASQAKVPETSGNASKGAEQRVLVEQLRSESGLDERDKRLAEICLVEGRTHQEAAALLGISQGYVSKRLKKVRATLKSRILSHPA